MRLPGISGSRLPSALLFVFHIHMITSPFAAEPEEPLASIFNAMPEACRPLLNKPEHEVQVLYVAIDRDAENRPRFSFHRWQVDAGRYFYPASTVKLPVVLFALEKLARLQINGLDRDTTMLTEAAEPWQTEAHVDKTSPTGLPSVGHYVRKIFLASDNDAHNRLLEFMGVDELDRRLKETDLEDVCIVQRLAVRLPAEAPRRANPVRFLDTGGRLLHREPARTSLVDYRHGLRVEKGRAHYRNGVLVNEPMSFSDKNAYPLETQVDTLIEVLFPESVEDVRRFRLSEDDRLFVLKAMSQYPRESGIPAYEEKRDAYVKPLLEWAGEPLSGSIRSFNKSGRAYGYLIDNAYIVDFERGIEFILAAVIHANANGIYNDDIYEYDTVSLPFFRALGRAVYDWECRRPRVKEPDLGAFSLDW